MIAGIHISLIYAGILGLFLVILSFNVMQNWVRVTGQGRETDRAMRRAERVLSSFVEYVPLALILLVMTEVARAPSLVVHGMGVTLVAARVMHAYGSNEFAYAGLLRFWGAQLTFLMLAMASIACIYLFVIGAR